MLTAIPAASRIASTTTPARDGPRRISDPTTTQVSAPSAANASASFAGCTRRTPGAVSRPDPTAPAGDGHDPISST